MGRGLRKMDVAALTTLIGDKAATSSPAVGQTRQTHQATRRFVQRPLETFVLTCLHVDPPLADSTIEREGTWDSSGTARAGNVPCERCVEAARLQPRCCSVHGMVVGFSV